MRLDAGLGEELAESFRYIEITITQVVALLPGIENDLRTARNIIGDGTSINFHTLYGSTNDLPVNIANDLQETAEAANSQQFFAFWQKMEAVHSQMDMIESEAMNIRDDLFAIGKHSRFARAYLHRLQRLWFYLDGIYNLVFAMSIEEQELKLAANARYVHGLQAGTEKLQQTEELNEAISRLLAVIATVGGS